MRAIGDGDSIGTGAWDARRHRTVCLRQNTPDSVSRGVALAVAMEQALAAVQHLRETMEVATRYHAEVVVRLARAQALTEGCAEHKMRALQPLAGAMVDEAKRAPVSGIVRPAALSRREAEVLSLLATGHSNRRIAQTLCLSPRTVQRHVANAYPKIGAHCRAEATAYALRQHLT